MNVHEALINNKEIEYIELEKKVLTKIYLQKFLMMGKNKQFNLEI